MSDVTINYKGAAISTMDASGTKTLLTEGKYCEDDIEVVYVKPSGGSAVDRGTFTPASNTLTVELTVTRTITGLMIVPEANPYAQGSGVRTNGAVLYDSYGTTAVESFGSNAGGGAPALGYGGNASVISQSGNTVTVTNQNNAQTGYFIAGLTYRWVAW